ncbi:uncharacterized protein BDZ99DRAFT_457840 [Mytilinidion resinicola]|uniref:Uncharacterized protein n=1 Tax=Mytilinidion resinicola TaxID=574789 RepID=A0A6A6Z6N1_9PEZI|nr:uncharacterized protein BDZ99DRAFT_457840 [Mytilinidion resinicola]KAF2815895.1 hypothetical protein BDZ99DRAFT_457840 [Mytilinidion resinicola]
MHFRKHKSQASEPPADPIVTYHLTQTLSGKLTVTPMPSTYRAYSITLNKPRAARDTIEVVVHRSGKATPASTFDTVGHCLIQAVRGKFLECRLDSDGTDVQLERKGSSFNNTKAWYNISAQGHPNLKWEHDADGGGRTSPDRRLKLVEEGSDGVVARFAGAETGVSEFGVLEIYKEQMVRDLDWCGLLVLTAVCVYAREERSREKNKKANDVAGLVGNWGGLLTMGVPVGN